MNYSGKKGFRKMMKYLFIFGIPMMVLNYFEANHADIWGMSIGSAFTGLVNYYKVTYYS